MHLCTSFTTLFALSSILLAVSAGPLNKRQAASTSSSTTSAAPTEALIVTTISGSAVTTAVPVVQTGSSSKIVSSASATATDGSSSATSAAASSTYSPLAPSNDFPVCHDTTARPFCLPNNGSVMYVGDTYYVTWNPDFFPVNSTITIVANYYNNTKTQAWASDKIDNGFGRATVQMQNDWLQGSTSSNLTFFLSEWDSANDKEASTYDGPTVMLKPKPLYVPTPQLTSSKSVNKEGLMIGLPVGLGALILVLVGLCIGMRKTRQIGIGRIMRKKRGYGVGKSRRQRMGLSKGGAIRLQEREMPDYSDDYTTTAAPPTVYRDEVPKSTTAAPPRLAEPQFGRDDFAPAPIQMPASHTSHSRDLSLGSLVDDDEPMQVIEPRAEETMPPPPAPKKLEMKTEEETTDNDFRNEMQRQQEERGHQRKKTVPEGDTIHRESIRAGYNIVPYDQRIKRWES